MASVAHQVTVRFKDGSTKSYGAVTANADPETHTPEWLHNHYTKENDIKQLFGKNAVEIVEIKSRSSSFVPGKIATAVAGGAKPILPPAPTHHAPPTSPTTPTPASTPTPTETTPEATVETLPAAE